MCSLFTIILPFVVFIVGFIKRISKEGVIKIQRRKEPSVEVVYEAIN